MLLSGFFSCILFFPIVSWSLLSTFVPKGGTRREGRLGQESELGAGWGGAGHWVTQNVQNRMGEPRAELGPSSGLAVSNQDRAVLPPSRLSVSTVSFLTQAALKSGAVAPKQPQFSAARALRWE